MKIYRIVYWIATGLLSLMMLAYGATYVLNYAGAEKTFESLGYPSYIIYPLAIARILGVLVILTNPATLKEWAYAGLFYNFVLAISAHVNAGTGGFGGATAALVLLAISYFTRPPDRSV